MGTKANRQPTKHLTQENVFRIHWASSLSAFKRPDLSHRANRVLAYFRALYVLRNGYLGTCLDFAVLAVAVAKATGEKCGRSTAFAAVKELVGAGFLLRTVTRMGKARQYGPDSWAHDPRTQLTLTEKARALFEGPALPAVMAATGTDPNPVQILDGKERLSPSGSPSGPPTVKSKPAPGPAPVVASSFSVVPDEVSPSGTLHGGRYEGEGEQFPRQPCKHSKPTTRRKTVDSILATLAKVLAAKAAGRRALARAALELADHKAQPRSPIAWDYWVRRWPEFSWPERYHFARLEIAPLLLELDNVFKLADATPGGGAFKRPGPAPAPAPAPAPREPAPPPPPTELATVMREAAQGGNRFALAWLLARGLDTGLESV